MAELSNQLMALTVVSYLAAMIGYAAEYAFGDRRRAVRDREAACRRGRAGPGLRCAGPGRDAGVPRAAAPGPQRVGRPDRGGAERGRPARCTSARWSTRGIAADRMPWGNMYEFILSVTFVGSAAWLVVLSRRPAVRHLGLFVTLVLVMLLGAAGLVAYTPVGPLVPALHSYWFVIHVLDDHPGVRHPAARRGAGRDVSHPKTGYDQGKRRFPYPLGRHVPAAEALERLTFRLHAFAFPLFTFGALIAGPLWAEASWGRYWGWDPKEVWAFISWIVYACYLHARATPSVKRTTATWIALLGFATMLMNLFGVNLFFSGLHSYANPGGM